MTASKLTTAVESYLADLRRIRDSGGATDERSLYPPLSTLLNAIGDTLKPKVFCVSDMAEQGAGHPDFGIYVKRRSSGSRSKAGLKASKSDVPERGVVEVKPLSDDAWLTAESAQVSRYWERYRLVLVTNCRDFVLLGEDAQGRPAKLETFRLAASAEEFAERLQTPHSFAREVGAGLGEYLCRALSHRAVLAEPRDLAWLLASYARDGLARVEASGDAPSLTAVRNALEEALGVRFEGAKGAAFFRSTLVQTLFYGVFSAWVLWSRQLPPPAGAFEWRTAVWHLRAPVLRALFQQLSDPARLQTLGLVEVLNWTAAALDRVDKEAFFASFSEGEAVPYFYEPFLEAFDPVLRKQLGVWYTPVEVVRYMVARVDKALKDDLGIEDGLADERVYVLDPCCGTGAYLAETLRRIAENLQSRGTGVLTGAQVKRAAMERVFGFEIMPAPFVVAHLQVGLTLQSLDAPLAEDAPSADGEAERAGMFLTNALTGWEPKTQKPLPFPELEQERERADRVKQDAPILVVLGNPPYNGYAGMAVDEERELSEAYRTTKRVRRPEGQGLNDLYVRFFRMAERRIAEKTGQGIVCFISNYSWLEGLSFTGMRERYLEAFDTIRIDCLNGDKYKTGKTTPDGAPDPSIFSTPEDPVGIQVGTAITTLVRKADHTPTEHVAFRHLWGQAKRTALLETAETEPEALYESASPLLPLGLPFAPTAVSQDWFDWPALPDLFPASFPGVQTGHDPFLVEVDLGRLKARIADYFNAKLGHEEIAGRFPSIMQTVQHFDGRSKRDILLNRGGPSEAGFVKFAYRPFDVRWLYWESDSGLLNRPRAEYMPHVFEGNVWLSSAQHLRKGETQPQAWFTRPICSMHMIERGTSMFPAWLRDTGLGADETGVQRIPNLSPAAQRYLDRLGLGVEDLFYHTLAVLHDPSYREANAGALRMEWPRIPLPGWPELSASSPAGRGGSRTAPTVALHTDAPAADHSVVPVKTRPVPGRGIHPASDAADILAASAARGRQLAHLLDSDTPVPGVTTSDLRPEIVAIAQPATTDDRNMTGDDFGLTAGWGHYGSGEAVMPGQGKAIERAYTPAECDALPSRHSGASRNPELPSQPKPLRQGETTNRAPESVSAASVLGETTYDIYLNDRAYWRNVPANVWHYKLGGYQVLKKWLSYREQTVLGRPLKPEEVQHFTDTARRIGAILLLTKRIIPIVKDREADTHGYGTKSS
ncbi:MAG: N-6 DNA methylase [Chloroflexi bacterium]|nr:N-6 DNA methylase [Chloroflexota bacterium]